MIKIKKDGYVWETNTHTYFKYLFVVPVFKNVDRSQTANYRVISSIIGFSKIFEILIYQLIIQHIQCHNILVCEQTGFRKGFSMDSATHKLRERIYDAWNNGMYFVTWSRHSTLLIMNYQSRSWNFMVLEVFSYWFTSYLDGRKETVHLKILRTI